MVVQKSQSRQRIEVHTSTAKSFFGMAFAHSMTVYPLKLDEIPPGYTSPVLYMGMLSSINTAVTLAVLVMGPGTWSAKDILLKYLCGATAWALYFLLAVFLSSWIGAKIAGIEHGSRQFGLVVSSLTYISILNVLRVIDVEILMYIARLAGSLLMSYYIRESYQESVTYQNTRTSTIHGVWIFVYCILFPYINDVTFQLTMRKGGY